MAIYRMKIPGAKPFLVKATSRAKAFEQVVDVETLSAEDMAEALAGGERTWKPDDRIEVEEKVCGQITRINFETGNWETVDQKVSRAATVDELNLESDGDLFRVDVESGMVQRQPAGADSGHWEDIREATADEVKAAKKK